MKQEQLHGGGEGGASRDKSAKDIRCLRRFFITNA